MADNRAVRPSAHRRGPARRRLAAATLPLAVLLLGACEQGGTTAKPKSDASSAEATPGQGEETGKGDADDAASDDAGDQDAANGTSARTKVAEGQAITPEEFRDIVSAGLDQTTTAHLTMANSGGVAEFRGEGDIDYTTSPPSMRMTMSLGGVAGQQAQEIEMRLVGGSVYMKLPGAGGGKFLAFDLQDPANPLGKDFAVQTDPQQQLDVLTRGLRKVVYVGSQDGLDQYRLTVATGKVARSLGMDATAELPKALTYDLWFDDQQRMRRMVMDVGGPAGRFEMRLDAYGEKVDISKPAPGEIMQAPTGG